MTPRRMCSSITRRSKPAPPPACRTTSGWSTPRSAGTRDLRPSMYGRSKMNNTGAWNRRHLPTSPFKPPPGPPPVEHFEVGDLVTPDRYGLGRVILVEGDASVVIDFGPRKVRIPTPF